MDEKPASEQQLRTLHRFDPQQKLWFLERRKENDDRRGDIDAFIIHTLDEERARQLASVCAGSEGMHVWLDPKKSTCEQITQEKKHTIVHGFKNSKPNAVRLAQLRK
jgi:hypothetical protein